MVKYRKRIILSIVIILLLLFTIGQGLVKAAIKEKVELDLEIIRTTVENENFIQGRAYSLNTGDDHPVFQISSRNGNEKNTNYFCVNATRGVSWSGTQAKQGVEYDSSYDIKSERSEIENLTEAYSNVAGEYYSQIVWLLDNFAVGRDFDEDESLSVDAILARAGIVYGDTGAKENGQPIIAYYYNDEVNPNSVFSKEEVFSKLYGNPYSLKGRGYSYITMDGNTEKIEQVKLSKELIEVIEQSALWYFTNKGNPAYDCYSETGVKDWLRYAEDPTASIIKWNLLSNEKVTATNSSGEAKTIDVGAMLQEQASILYNYFIDKANEEASLYHAAVIEKPISISFTIEGTNNLEKQGNSYKIGPLEVTTNHKTSIDGYSLVSGSENSEVSGIVLQDENGKNIEKITEGKKFYVIVNSSEIKGNIIFKVNGTTKTVNEKLRIKEVTDDAQAEQPVVEIIKKKEPVSDQISVTISENKQFDLALRKAITEVTNSEGKTLPIVNEDKLAAVREANIEENTIPNTATYKHRKDPVVVSEGDIVNYRISIFNEGDIDGYASIIVDQLPLGLESTLKTGNIIKSNKNGNTYTVQYDINTNKLTFTLDKNQTVKSIPAYSKNQLSYDTLDIKCKVVQKAGTTQNENYYLTNIAYIAEEYDKDGNKIEADRDGNESKPTVSPSQTNLDLNSKEVDSYKGNNSNQSVKNDTNNNYYYQGEQDDDDFEKVVVLPIIKPDEPEEPEAKKFDLALRKFITNIAGKDINTRIPKVEYKDKKLLYTHPKTVEKVGVGSVVTYTLRIYNEGEVSGYAEKVTDDIPEYLEFLPTNSINTQYRWKMYNKDGKETTSVNEAVNLVTDYTSKAYGEELMKGQNLKENPNLLNAFNPDEKLSETNPDFVDLKIAFKVKDPNSNKAIITNKAQISEDANQDGNPVDDIDSTPNKWVEGEDDQDYENISVEYFDLSLLKYVTKAIVIENGTTKITNTGNNGSSKDIIPKVEIYRKNLDKTIVKFEFTIKITNEGDIAGFAREITDYVPSGLKFYKEDNEGWTDEGNNVISTKLLQNTLLQPGQSATVNVVLRWINGEKNLGLKTNTAEISEDYNEKNIPDKDSIPDNKKNGEDDIDDAPVLLTVSTGILEHTVEYMGGAVLILLVLGIGIMAIKKYVL